LPLPGNPFVSLFASSAVEAGARNRKCRSVPLLFGLTGSATAAGGRNELPPPLQQRGEMGVNGLCREIR